VFSVVRSYSTIVATTKCRTPISSRNWVVGDKGTRVTQRDSKGCSYLAADHRIEYPKTVLVGISKGHVVKGFAKEITNLGMQHVL
jgi:hypothetical protein